MTELETLLGKQWTKRNGEVDQSMVDYCLKSSKYIDMGEYYLNIGDAKPRISNTLYYDDETDAPDISDFEVFKNYNMRGKRFNLVKLVDSGRSVCVFTSDNRSGGKLKGWTTCYIGEHPGLRDCRLATVDDIMAIKQGLAEIKADFEKRLASYWKRYGDKIRTSGYWANR
jgi:hypothetical protein